MASKGGARAIGSDGTDYKHRQRIAANIKLSVRYKFYMKLIFLSHFLILLLIWMKVGCELLFNEFNIVTEPPKLWKKLDLPSAYPWEYAWCFSFIPILFALASFPRNNLTFLTCHYYGQYFFGVMPCCIGLGNQLLELYNYITNSKNRITFTFSGQSPMVLIWCIFFLVVFQIHFFSMYFSLKLNNFWDRNVTTSTKEANEFKKNE